MNIQTTGIGTRVLNAMVDIVPIVLLALLFFRVYNWYVFYYTIPAFNFGWFFFGTLFLYYTLFESIFYRTPGKWLTQTKVVSIVGKHPTLLQIILRSLVRITIIDIFFFPFLNKTLHDFISKTEVIQVS